MEELHKVKTIEEWLEFLEWEITELLDLGRFESYMCSLA